MHMRIKYHFLVDFRVTRHAGETDSETHPEYSKQTL